MITLVEQERPGTSLRRGCQTLGVSRATLYRHRHPAPPSAEEMALRDALLAETAGNPFFVGEVLRHLAEAGAIYRTDSGRWVGVMDLQAVGLPVSVKEVVGRRESCGASG